jgi:hypothetical protein
MTTGQRFVARVDLETPGILRRCVARVGLLRRDWQRGTELIVVYVPYPAFRVIEKIRPRTDQDPHDVLAARGWRITGERRVDGHMMFDIVPESWAVSSDA